MLAVSCWLFFTPAYLELYMGQFSFLMASLFFWLGLSLAYVFPTLPPSTMVISAAVGIYAAAMTLPGLARLTRVKA